MILGSLYSGIGGLDLACEWALGCTTVWQLDLVGADVRRRHWPDALHVESDVATVDPLDLPWIDVLCAGFACQDLSCAGAGASRDDLHAGSRTGPTWRGVVRFVEALRPELVVLENVPAVLGRRVQIEAELSEYGWTWCRARALDAGAPHIRRRAFAVGVRGGVGGGVVDAPRDREWTAPSERPWPTATCGDARASGSRSGEHNDAHDGTSLTDAVRADRSVAGERPWATATCADARSGWTQEQAAKADRRNLLGDQTGGGRLNPSFVDSLMGYPIGWTLPAGEALTCDPSPRWPRGRYPADWDRTVPWPGYDWEPARVLPDGPPIPGRPARLRALGNAVVPQQGALAIRTALGSLPLIHGEGGPK